MTSATYRRPAAQAASDPDLALHIAPLLEMRLRFRGNPDALALVDRCLAIVAQAEGASEERLAALRQEVRTISDDLAMRFGAPGSALIQ